MPERSCETSCVCPPSASETVLPCLTAHFVRPPAGVRARSARTGVQRRFEPREERQRRVPASASHDQRDRAAFEPREARSAESVAKCEARSMVLKTRPVKQAGVVSQLFRKLGSPSLCASLCGSGRVASGAERRRLSRRAGFNVRAREAAVVQRKVSGETRPAESGGRAWPKRPCQMVRHETIGWVAEAGEIENTALPSACPNN